MDCKECGLLLKEIALLQALLKVEETKVEERDRLIKRMEKDEDGD